MKQGCGNHSITQNHQENVNIGEKYSTPATFSVSSADRNISQCIHPLNAALNKHGKFDLDETNFQEIGF